MESAPLRCPECGNEEHPITAIFCVKCAALIRPDAWKPSRGASFPCLLNVRTWLEGAPQHVLGAYRRGFAIAFTVMDAPRQPVTPDGTLHIELTGVGNGTSFGGSIAVRQTDFAVRRFQHGMVTFATESYLYRQRDPVVAVPTDSGCELRLRFEARDGRIYEAAQRTYFLDSPVTNEGLGAGDSRAGCDM